MCLLFQSEDSFRTFETQAKNMNSALDIKNNLISRIQKSNDLEFLKALQVILENAEKGLYELNEAQILSIQESRAQYKRGQTIPNDQAISDVKEWLKNQ